MSKGNSLISAANKTGQSAGKGNLGGFVLGMLIGIIWTPCAGPILGSILTLIALQKNLGQASALLISYAIGAGLPMLAIAYGGQALTTKIKRVAKYSQRIQKFFGVILIFLAIAIYFQYDTFIEGKILNIFPSLGTTLEEGLISNSNKSTKSEAGIPAPEFTGISKWLNSDPLTVKSLRGKVVLVDFWTYSCINCVRTLPHVTDWYNKYKDQGLVVIGVHSPEFAFEKDSNNVMMAISQYKINYPVAQDNNLSTWRAYSNNYWPAEYLIDQNGNVVYTHFGEGEYDVTENTIRTLLGISGDVGINNGQDLTGVQSPEMYFGTEREQYLSPYQQPSLVSADYSLPSILDLNQFALGGRWKFLSDRANLSEGSGEIKLHFSSGKLFMVAESLNNPVTLNITVDGQPQPDVVVGPSQLYTLFDSEKYTDHVVDIKISGPGFDAFTFTFG